MVIKLSEPFLFEQNRDDFPHFHIVLLGKSSSTGFQQHKRLAIMAKEKQSRLEHRVNAQQDF